jgi:hypothetical protein
MTGCLIGSSGFVGSNYLALFPDVRNITREELYSDRGKIECESLVISAPTAEKWQVNKSPNQDRWACEELVKGILKNVLAKRVMLFSTIDIYGKDGFPTEKDEPTPSSPYGSNRLWFAREIENSFEHTFVARLPGLFGTGLKKNVLFDILHGRAHLLGKVNPNSTFQWMEVKTAILHSRNFWESGEKVVNVVSEPLPVRDIPLPGDWQKYMKSGNPEIHYNIRTTKSASGYFLSQAQVVDSIKEWLV